MGHVLGGEKGNFLIRGDDAAKEPFGVKVFVVEPGTMRTPLALARAETAGLRTEPAALRSYPVLGEALVGACFVDDCRVEFVRFLDC